MNRLGPGTESVSGPSLICFLNRDVVVRLSEFLFFKARFYARRA